MIHKCLILTKEILELALKIGPIPGFHFIDVMFDFHLEDMAILLRYGYLFIVAIFAGIRQGELLGLPWENVDFVRMTITIDRQLQKNKEGYFFCTPKNGTARSFAVAPVMMEALKKENEKQENLHSLLGGEWNNEQNLLRRTVVKHYKKVLARVGLPDNRFHDLRHSFAVNSLAVGDNIKMCSRIWDIQLLHLLRMFTVMYPNPWSGKVRPKHRNSMKA